MRGVLFDVDDTLVDHAGAQASAIRDHLADLGLPHDDAAVTRWNDAQDRHYPRHLAGELTFQEQRRVRVREVLDDPELDDQEADAWFAGYATRFEAAWAPFDDVLALLDGLRRDGVRLGIVTNAGVDYQRRKLEIVGLSGHFPVLVGLDTVGVAKPDPRVFRHACDLLRTDPQETAFVGDRLDHDAIGARDAGLRAVWLDRAGTGVDVPEGVTRVTSLADLASVLEAGLEAGLEAVPGVSAG